MKNLIPTFNEFLNEAQDLSEFSPEAKKIVKEVEKALGGKFKIEEDDSMPNSFMLYFGKDLTDDGFSFIYAADSGFYLEEDMGDGTILDEDGEWDAKKIIDGFKSIKNATHKWGKKLK